MKGTPRDYFTMNGKGSSPRNCFSQQFRENYDHIFRTITSDDWKRAVKRARSTRNNVSEKLKLQQSALSVGGGSYNTQGTEKSVKPKA